MKRIYLLFLGLIMKIGVAQTSVNVNLNHLYEGQPFALDQVIETPDYNFKITRFQYYLSNFTVFHDGGTETSIDDSYLLVDATQNSYVLNDLSGVSDAEKIKFHFGVDEPTNHDDPAQYDNSHALAYKSPSMHWGWSGGYMFAYVEGVVDGDKDGVFDIPFDIVPIHDDYYTSVTRPTNDEVSNNSILLNIDVNLDNWIEYIFLVDAGSNHGKNGKVDLFVENITTNQVFMTSATVATDNNSFSENIFNVINNGASPIIVVTKITRNYNFNLYDVSGKYIARIDLEKNQIKLSDYLKAPGTYILSLQHIDNKTIETKKILYQPK